jgi:hypothetical protein
MPAKPLTRLQTIVGLLSARDANIKEATTAKRLIRLTNGQFSQIDIERSMQHLINQELARNRGPFTIVRPAVAKLDPKRFDNKIGEEVQLLTHIDGGWTLKVGLEFDFNDLARYCRRLPIDSEPANDSTIKKPCTEPRSVVEPRHLYPPGQAPSELVKAAIPDLNELDECYLVTILKLVRADAVNGTELFRLLQLVSPEEIFEAPPDRQPGVYAEYLEDINQIIAIAEGILTVAKRDRTATMAKWDREQALRYAKKR